MSIDRVTQTIRTFPREAAIWATALVALALMDPGSATHISICPVAWMGFDFCPGCGLGRSISLFLHGSIVSSIRMHPLGIIACLVLSLRIVRLTKNHFNDVWQK